MAQIPDSPLHCNDMLENFQFRLGDSEHGLDDPVELVDRVRRGVKPMATILLKCGRHIHLGPTALKRVAEGMGLDCKIVNTKGCRVEGVVYNPRLTLEHFYPVDEIIGRYAGAGVALSRDVFTAPLSSYANSLANENFTPLQIKYPLMGLCFGYPISSTIELIKSL